MKRAMSSRESAYNSYQEAVKDLKRIVDQRRAQIKYAYITSALFVSSLDSNCIPRVMPRAFSLLCYVKGFNQHCIVLPVHPY